MAERGGVKFQEPDRLTHYWMLQAPEGVAEILRRFRTAPGR
ncbi:hypothetical protein [Nocardiopsis sp. MG754419]|nr:hypothetical protein [Nocardiopsis sp. MG754419]